MMKTIKNSRLNSLKDRLKIIKCATYKHLFASPFLTLPVTQELIRNIANFKTHTNDFEINQVCDKLLIQLNIITKQLKKSKTLSTHIGRQDSEDFSSQETFYEPPEFIINLNDIETPEPNDIHSYGTQGKVIQYNKNSQETGDLEQIQSNKPNACSTDIQVKIKCKLNKKSCFNYRKAKVLRFHKRKSKPHTKVLNASKLLRYVNNNNKILFKRKLQTIKKPSKPEVRNIQSTSDNRTIQNTSKHIIIEELSQSETNIFVNNCKYKITAKEVESKLPFKSSNINDTKLAIREFYSQFFEVLHNAIHLNKNDLRNLNSEEICSKNESLLNENNSALIVSAEQSVFVNENDFLKQNKNTENNTKDLSTQKITLRPSVLNYLESTQTSATFKQKSQGQFQAGYSEPSSYDLFKTSQSILPNLVQFNTLSNKKGNSTNGELLNIFEKGASSFLKEKQEVSEEKNSIVNNNSSKKSISQTNLLLSESQSLSSQLKSMNQLNFKVNPFTKQFVNETTNVHSFSNSQVLSSISQPSSQANNIKTCISMQCANEAQNCNSISHSQKFSSPLKPLNQSTKLKLNHSSMQSGIDSQNANLWQSQIISSQTQPMNKSPALSFINETQSPVYSTKIPTSKQYVSETHASKEKSNALLVNETQEILNKSTFLSQSQMVPLQSKAKYKKKPATSVQHVNEIQNSFDKNLCLSQSEILPKGTENSFSINETQYVNSFSQSQAFPPQFKSEIRTKFEGNPFATIKARNDSNNNLFLSQSQIFSSQVRKVVNQPKIRKKRVTKTNNKFVNKEIIQQSIDDVKKFTLNEQCRKKLI